MKYFLMIFFLAQTIISAQELNCRVTVNTEGLPVVNRDNLIGFGEVIQDYMNKTKFLNENWDVQKIDCALNIYFTSAGDEVNYSAQVVVTSMRPVFESDQNVQMLSIVDNSWQFVYERNQPLYSNPNIYDPITSFLDFYAYLIIGYDTDSYEQLGGTSYYSSASNIVRLGSSSRYSKGWVNAGSSYTRSSIIEDLQSEKWRPFREAFFDYHYNGIDVFEKDKRAAQERIVKLITTLDGMRSKINLNSPLMKVFFDAKHGEIIDRLRGYPDKNIYQTLRKVDPAHISKYDEAALR